MTNSTIVLGWDYPTSSDEVISGFKVTLDTVIVYECIHFRCLFVSLLVISKHGSKYSTNKVPPVGLLFYLHLYLLQVRYDLNPLPPSPPPTPLPAVLIIIHPTPRAKTLRVRTAHRGTGERNIGFLLNLLNFSHQTQTITQQH